jgi:hypothetical protein
MVISYLKGHEIYYKNNMWMFSDTDEKIYKRACIKCGGISDYDDCLGIIDNTISACCGHGVTKGFIKK